MFFRRKFPFVSGLISLTLLAFTSDSQQLTWYSFEKAVEQVRKKPKYIFIDVYTNWCGWCKVMDRKTFRDPQIVQALNKYYYPVKLNAETRDTIYFNGQAHYYMPEYRANLLAIRLLDGRMAYPSIVILDSRFRRLIILRGYQSPEELHPYLLYYGQGHYKRMKFREFKREIYSRHYGRR